MTSGKNFIKKSYDSVMAKLKRIEEDNFLIPKKKEEEKKDDTASDKSSAASSNDEALNTILQNELR